MKVLGTTNLDYNINLNKEWKRKLEVDVTKIFFDLIQNKINEYDNKILNNEEKIDNNINVGELEKIMKMYQDGLLNDEEFVAMKQNIIGTMNTANDSKNDDDTQKFCGNCGTKIIKNSKFCTQCGTQL